MKLTPPPENPPPPPFDPVREVGVPMFIAFASAALMKLGDHVAQMLLDWRADMKKKRAEEEAKAKAEADEAAKPRRRPARKKRK